MEAGNYIGRFAPSPTGPLHFGSLVAAVASYLDARAHGGKWIVRMEDVDLPRCVPGADTEILRTLAQFGFEWDGPVIYQTARTPAYSEALEKLKRIDMAYPCTCSRKEVGAPVYPGTCRTGVKAHRPRGASPLCASSPKDPAKPAAWRVKVDDAIIGFEDRALGWQQQNLAAEVGDFVVQRADGLFAYQLAVVVDDAMQGITHVVRGADLLDSTARQIRLQKLLGFPTPRYLHVPIATNQAGEKLSKQTCAPPISPSNAAAELCAALRFLGQKIPKEQSTPPAILARAIDTWRLRLARLNPGLQSPHPDIPVPHGIPVIL